MSSMRFVLGAVAATSLIAALGMGMLTTGGAAAGSSDKTTRLVLYAGEPQIGPTTIDVGPAGESQGDMTVVTGGSPANSSLRSKETRTEGVSLCAVKKHSTHAERSW
jgi:hypothetical protein